MTDSENTDKLEGKDANKKDDWKEQMYQEQQKILKRRRASGGFLDEEQEKEIRERREAIGKEAGDLKKIQQTKGDPLGAWKQARDSGKIKTATKGLERDKKSSRFGAAGLFAERVDERLPYIDRGYVAEDKKKDGDDKPDFFEDLKKNIFGKK